MVAVMNVAMDQTLAYGIITPGKDDGKLIEVTGLVEKPQPKDAPSNIAVVGRYIIEPAIFQILSNVQRGTGGEVQLTDALAQQIGNSAFYGLRFSGERFDCGSKMGFLKANIAFAMANEALAPDLHKWIKDRYS